MHKVRRAGLILFGLLVLAGCAEDSGDDGGGPINGGDGGTPVLITDNATLACQNAYNPAELTVLVGTKVTWTNNDNTPHTVTSSSSSGPDCTPGGDPSPLPRELNSEVINPGETYSHTFDQAGTFEYVCIVGGHQMRGTVIVQ